MDNLRHQQYCKYHWHMFCKEWIAHFVLGIGHWHMFCKERIAHFVLGIGHWHMFCKRIAYFDLGIVHWHMFCKKTGHFDLGTCPVNKSVCRDICVCCCRRSLGCSC